MALADFDAYKTAMSTAATYPFVRGDSGSVVATRLHSCWLGGPGTAGATPSTAVVPTAATTGALIQTPQFSDFAATPYLGQLEVHSATNAFSSMMLIDRLSHQGGLSGTTTGAQTTNLPTAALTRYTDGIGVMIALEIYSAVGTTATTATVSYTNQAGTSGRTSKAVVFGGTNELGAGRFIICPLQDGDTGVKSVESVTLAASTVSAAGNFGVTLFRILALIPNSNNSIHSMQPRYWNGALGSGGGLIEIKDSACLGLLGYANTTGLGTATGYMRILEA